VASLQANGSGAQTLKTHEGHINLPVGDAYEVFGLVQCDQDCTLTLEWGFSHKTGIQANDQSIMPHGGATLAPVFVAVETISVTGAAFSEGNGLKIAPILVAGEYLKVKCLNSDVATSNFRIYLAKRT